jgi:hypothetical protein
MRDDGLKLETRGLVEPRMGWRKQNSLLAAGWLGNVVMCPELAGCGSDPDYAMIVQNWGAVLERAVKAPRDREFLTVSGSLG